MSPQPMLLVFAGSNGAGKSNLRDATLSDISIPYVDADEIAYLNPAPSPTEKLQLLY